jgi:hypothetical protein
MAGGGGLAGGGSGGGDGTAGRDGGVPDGHPAGDAAAFDPAADFVDVAAVTVTSLPYGLQGDYSLLTVMPRLPAAAGGMDPTCTWTRAGDCLISHCTRYDPNLARLSPGYIHVDSADGTVHVVAGGESYTGPRPFVGGEDVTVSTTGGDVPAFTVGLHVPLMLLVEQPTMPNLYPTNVQVAAPHTAPLTLSWQRGAPGVLLVAQAGSAQSFGAFGGSNVTCFFDSQAGAGTIPAAALSEMIPGQVIVLLTATVAPVDAGGRPVEVWILEEVLTPDKKAAVVVAVQ